MKTGEMNSFFNIMSGAKLVNIFYSGSDFIIKLYTNNHLGMERTLIGSGKTLGLALSSVDLDFYNVTMNFDSIIKGLKSGKDFTMSQLCENNVKGDYVFTFAKPADKKTAEPYVIKNNEAVNAMHALMQGFNYFLNIKKTYGLKRQSSAAKSPNNSAIIKDVKNAKIKLNLKQGVVVAGAKPVAQEKPAKAPQPGSSANDGKVLKMPVNTTERIFLLKKSKEREMGG